MHGVNFITLNNDEVTLEVSRINVHGYVVISWKRTYVFVTLERVVEGGTPCNLIVVIVNIVCAYGGLFEQNSREFRSLLGQMRFLHFMVLNQVSLYNLSTNTLIVDVHCMTHHTSIVVQNSLSFRW